ncbi:MAG: hypothetical protein ACR2RF_25300 [Geminicoccaceae bacterium]
MAKLRIIQHARHRNGVSGQPFELFLFEEKRGQCMLAIRFESDPTYPACAVLNVEKLAKGDIAMGSNSWRGDTYNELLPPPAWD